MIIVNIVIFRTQIRGALKKKAYEDMGLPMPTSNAIAPSPASVGTSSSPTKPSASTASPVAARQKTPLNSPLKSSEVTLNMLNASDGDVENLNSRMDFESTVVSS